MTPPTDTGPDPRTAPIHPKVKAATVGSLAASIVMAVLVWTQSPDLMGSLPTWAQGVVVAFVPPGLTLLAGYRQSA